MRPRHTSRLILAAALALASGGAPAAATEPGVCVAYSSRDQESVAQAAQRTLGAQSLRLDVSVPGDRRQLAARCERLVIAVGAAALRAATELAPRSPTVHAMAGSARAAGQGGVRSDADPHRVFETLQRLAPRARRIGAVYDPAVSEPLIAEAQAATRALGLELVALPAKDVGEAVRAFHRFEQDLQVDALWLLPDGTATVQETVYYALELAHWRRMAVIGLSRWYVASGALFALVPRPESCGAAAGELGQLLLRGGAPSGVVHGCDYSLIVSQRTATKLGLTLPRKVLEGAEQVLP